MYFTTQRWILEAFFGKRPQAVEDVKFAEFYESAKSEIVLDGARRIGWREVSRDAGEIELVHLYLVPEAQNRGVGTAQTRSLLSEAAAAGVAVTLSTAKINPAVRLYERLGFVIVSEDATKVYLRCDPRAANA